MKKGTKILLIIISVVVALTAVSGVLAISDKILSKKPDLRTAENQDIVSWYKHYWKSRSANYFTPEMEELVSELCAEGRESLASDIIEMEFERIENHSNPNFDSLLMSISENFCGGELSDTVGYLIKLFGRETAADAIDDYYMDNYKNMPVMEEIVPALLRYYHSDESVSRVEDIIPSSYNDIFHFLTFDNLSQYLAIKPDGKILVFYNGNLCRDIMQVVPCEMRPAEGKMLSDVEFVLKIDYSEEAVGFYTNGGNAERPQYTVTIERADSNGGWEVIFSTTVYGGMPDSEITVSSAYPYAGDIGAMPDLNELAEAVNEALEAIYD